jgi:hypothetical protein
VSLLESGTSVADLTRTEDGVALARFAEREGYHLAGVFTDVRGRSEAGIYALVEAVRTCDAAAVVVPDLGHIRHVGCFQGADVRTASRYLRARLLVLQGAGTADLR